MSAAGVSLPVPGFSQFASKGVLVAWERSRLMLPPSSAKTRKLFASSVRHQVLFLSVRTMSLGRMSGRDSARFAFRKSYVGRMIWDSGGAM